jgi:peptidyl-prolyl cis-trans isomerase D
MNLDMIRKRHRWLTLFILFFISIAFIFGIGSFVSGDFGPSTVGTRGSAAEVNGEEISMNEYALERANMRRQYGQGQELSQAVIDIINLRALNQLIDYKLLAQKAEQMGYAVTNEEFNNAIHSDPSFQIDGQFVGVERYTNFIEQGLNQNLTDFENNYKQRILAQKLARFIGETIFVTDEKLMTTFDLQNETVNLNYIEFSSADFINDEVPSDEEIEKHYQSRKANFKTDELRKIRYIILEPENFENSVQVSDEEITAYYNAYPVEFQSEDGKTLTFEEAKDDVASNLKSQRAEVIRQEFLETFELSQNPETSIDQIAKENSIETITETAMFAASDRTGDIPPPIVNKAYSTQKGSLSVVPVGTSLWVVELSEISEPRDKTLEETKPDIIASIKNQKSSNKARKEANETLTKLKSAKKEEIADKAKELGVSLKETGPFTRMDRVPEINLEQVKSDAFELDDNSIVLGKVYESGNSFYVVILKERLSADPAEFELQKVLLQEQELQTERNNLLQKWIQNLRREAKIETNDDLFPTQG